MKILAIKSELLNHIPKNVLHALTPEVQRTLESQCEYLERDPLETNPTYRQVIPYILVRNGNNYCLMQRCKGQGEARLLGKHYFGAGGHVEDGHSIKYTALKECTEELGLPLLSLEIDGILVTDGSPVDEVHVCFFGIAVTNYSEFTSPEGPLHNAQWVSRAKLLEHVETMEKWSQLIAKQIL